MFQAIARLFSKVLDYDIAQYLKQLAENCQKSLEGNASQENGKLEIGHAPSVVQVQVRWQNVLPHDVRHIFVSNLLQISEYSFTVDT